jgi:hypothetical protein
MWSYEHEYRMLRFDWPGMPGRETFGRLLVEWEGETAMMSPGLVTGITIGARMNNAEREELLAHTSEHHPKLEVWQESLHKSRYELLRDQIR